MKRTAIIGGGSFGTAMACAGRRAGLMVTLWAREPEVVQAINSGKGNPHFLEGIPIESGIAASSDLGETIDGSESVLLAVPSQFLRSIARQIRPLLAPRTPVVSCSKGIEAGSCALMPDVISETLPDAIVAVLAGPSFAKEVALDLPTAVTLACADSRAAAELANDLSSARFRVFTSGDPVSATVGGAFKNVLAIACGIAIAREMGENMRCGRSCRDPEGRNRDRGVRRRHDRTGLVGPETKVPVGTPLARIRADGEAAPATPPAALTAARPRTEPSRAPAEPPTCARRSTSIRWTFPTSSSRCTTASRRLEASLSPARDTRQPGTFTP
jgi:predicted dinucleotide-binding enzyme